MIYKIAELLRDQISGLDFVEIAAGLAKPVIVRNNATPVDAEEPGMIDKIIPMAYNDLGLTCEEGDLYQLTPNTKKKSIVWWEDGGIELVEEQTYYYQARANLVCVGWWNLPLINATLTDPSILVANIIAAIPERLTNVDYLSQIRVAWEGEQVSGAEVLSKYTLNEEENQFTTYPYAVTGLAFSVDFAFGKNCVDDVLSLPSYCPPKMGLNGLLNFDGVDDYVALASLVTQVYGSKTITFYCKIPSGQDLSAFQVLISFSNAGATDGIGVSLSSDAGGANATMIVRVNNVVADAREFDIDDLFDTILEVVIVKTAGAITSVTVNSTAQTLTVPLGVPVSTSDRYIGCQNGNILFYKGQLWNIKIDGTVHWRGYPAGNKNSAWTDRVNSNNGTVYGSPSTIDL